MQVSRVELGGLGQTLPIENGQAALSEVERSFGSQLHQRAINVDRGSISALFGIYHPRLAETLAAWDRWRLSLAQLAAGG